MDSINKTGKIIGALFITVMITWGIGYGLIASILNTQEFLSEIYPNKIKMLIGVLFELIEIAAIIGIIALMYPIFKKYDERIAVGYVGFRILESIMLIVAVVCALILITLSQNFITIENQDISHFKTLATILVETRDKWVQTVLPIFYSSAALMLNYLFYKTKLVPRILSMWGFVSAALVLIEVPLGMLGINVLKFVGISMGLNELVLGIWLLVKGFNSSTNA